MPLILYRANNSVKCHTAAETVRKGLSSIQTLCDQFTNPHGDCRQMYFAALKNCQHAVMVPRDDQACTSNSQLRWRGVAGGVKKSPDFGAVCAQPYGQCRTWRGNKQFYEGLHR